MRMPPISQVAGRTVSRPLLSGNRRQAFCPPSAEEIAEKTGAAQDTGERVLRILTEHERLVRVADKLLFHREAVDRVRDILITFVRKEGNLESVRSKYLLDTTRKFAIPLPDYFNSVGLIRRSGEYPIPQGI